MRTKIVATLGPASINKQMMRDMAENGVRIFRLNFSHADAAYFVPIMKIIRELEEELARPLTAMADLCGPKIRIGEVKDSPRQVNKGEIILLGLEGQEPSQAEEAFIGIEIPELLVGLQVGMPVNLSDGLLQFKVVQVVKADKLYALEVQNAGFLSSHKGIAFPGKHHAMPALTAKDIKDLHEGLDIGVDAVALSFVQGPEDVAQIKGEIKKHGVWVPVCSKLERQNAVDRLDEILALSDVIMVARGDLGLECPLPELPIIQKRIIRACRHAQKPCIVATQMLLSMVKHPIPTRAETTDVANAILDGADCMMLSEETAVGDYPLQAVKVMQDIATQAEEYYLERIQGPYAPKKEKNPAKYLAYAATLLADNAESAAIVSHSTSGTTARILSSRRPNHPVFALTPDPRVMRYLNFVWGVEPRLLEATSGGHLERIENYVQQSKEFQFGESVVLTCGQPTPGQKDIQTNEVKLYYK
ncbi:MAG: pyruvate kinase [Desulfovibrionaceae bacterium]|nr:pyruvate kinase [Desulfovibrionaceae bacterium]MBF0512593.1 pyruvate kinase [Desulfovibrionaceae bacterium]